MTGYIPQWFTRPQTITHAGTNPIVLRRELTVELATCWSQVRHPKGLSTLATKVAENGDKKYPTLVAENGNKSRRKRWQKVSVFSNKSCLKRQVAENGDKKYPFVSICRRKRILFVSVFGDFCRQCGQALILPYRGTQWKHDMYSIRLANSRYL